MDTGESKGDTGTVYCIVSACQDAGRAVANGEEQQTKACMKIRELIVSRKKRLLAAFSMVEATVGLGILATVGGALMTGITGGFFTMQMARENLRATQIMLEKVETIRLYSWDQINTAGFIPLNFTNRYDPNSVSSQGLKYYGTMRISDAGFGTAYSPTMKKVTVTLNWKTGNLDRNRTFTTFIARDGLQNYIY